VIKLPLSPPQITKLSSSSLTCRVVRSSGRLVNTTFPRILVGGVGLADTSILQPVRMGFGIDSLR
jgi:hypothetical protein